MNDSAVQRFNGLTALRADVLNGLATTSRQFARCFKACRKELSEKRVHAFRIEARRLLSIYDLLEKAAPQSLLNKLRRSTRKKLNFLDELRDTHVQALAIGELSREFPELKPFYKRLAKREKQLRKPTRKKFKKTGVQKILRGLASLERQCRERALFNRAEQSRLILRAVDQAFADTVKLRRAINPVFTETIHCTRIAFKKFRYMIEAVTTLRKQCRPGQLAAMRQYQTAMGTIQDMEVLLKGLEKYAKSRNQSDESLSSVTSHLTHERHHLIRRYLRMADRLYTFWPLPHRPGATPRRKQSR